MVEIKGNRIILREISEEDSPLVVKWRNAELPRKTFFSDELLTEEKQLKWVQRYKENTSDITLIIEKGNNPIGMVALYNICDEKAEFGRLLIGEKEYRGYGYAKEASKLILEYGLKNLGLRFIYAKVFEDNKPALSLYIALGFEVKKRELHGDGRIILVMLLNREKFFKT